MLWLESKDAHLQMCQYAQMWRCTHVDCVYSTSVATYIDWSNWILWQMYELPLPRKHAEISKRLFKFLQCSSRSIWQIIPGSYGRHFDMVMTHKYLLRLVTVVHYNIPPTEEKSRLLYLWMFSHLGLYECTFRSVNALDALTWQSFGYFFTSKWAGKTSASTIEKTRTNTLA